MTHNQLSHLVLIVTLVLSSGLAQAQRNDSTPENAQMTDAVLREKAFNLLESLVSQINTLQSAENRARLGSNIAASLWTHDDKRARALLVAVEDDIKAGLQTRQTDDPTDVHTLMVFHRLRVDTVERIAKYDAESALAFLKATEVGSDKPLPYEVSESERAIEVRLAKQVAASHPDIALKLARQSLSRGFSDDLLPLLRQLIRKPRVPALSLYKEIVVKLRNANLAQDWNALYFAQNLANSFTPPAVDDATFRDLINLFTMSAFANGCGNKMLKDDSTGFCQQIAQLVPQIEKVDPLRAAQLKHWARARPALGGLFLGCTYFCQNE
ncbi:MAG: hypothetical protein ACR2H4_00500 [Pyrinomonadaceae bacterium]